MADKNISVMKRQPKKSKTKINKLKPGFHFFCRSYDDFHELPTLNFFEAFSLILPATGTRNDCVETKTRVRKFICNYTLKNSWLLYLSLKFSPFECSVPFTVSPIIRRSFIHVRKIVFYLRLSLEIVVLFRYYLLFVSSLAVL